MPFSARVELMTFYNQLKKKKKKVPKHEHHFKQNTKLKGKCP